MLCALCAFAVNKMKFQKRLCDICRSSFVPWHIKRVHQHNICPACLDLAIARQAELRELAEQCDAFAENSRPDCAAVLNDAQPAEANLRGIVRNEGNAFLDDIKAAARIINPKFTALIIGRASLYIGTLSYLKQDGVAYAVANGIMAADLVTWFIFNILQMPFVGVRFWIEFGIYGTMTSYLLSGDKLFNVPDESEQSYIVILVFLAFGFAKTAWWAVRLFCLDDPAEV